eukprot:g2834.t1
MSGRSKAKGAVAITAEEEEGITAEGIKMPMDTTVQGIKAITGVEGGSKAEDTRVVVTRVGRGAQAGDGAGGGYGEYKEQGGGGGYGRSSFGDMPPEEQKYQEEYEYKSDGNEYKSDGQQGVDDQVVEEIFSLTRHNKLTEVEELLDRGVPVNVRDRHGNSILSVACQNGLKKMAKLALRRGADINARNPEALKKRMLGAKPSKGQGPDGMYNEHLWMLGREYSEGTREWQVVDDYRFYAELYLNARLPRWALKYSAAARLVALHKQEVRPGRDLKVRPIAVGQVERRALCGVAVDIFADDLAGHLQPFQVACGVPASAERMAYGVRATLERNKDWCCLQVDARNAFNEWYRALIVPELAKSQQLRRLIPFVCALGGPAAPLAFGWQQGTLDASELEEWELDEGLFRGVQPPPMATVMEKLGGVRALVVGG